MAEKKKDEGSWLLNMFGTKGGAAKKAGTDIKNRKQRLDDQIERDSGSDSKTSDAGGRQRWAARG